MRARANSVFFASWGLVLAGTLILLLRFEAIPDPVPVFQLVVGEPTRSAPKSLSSVLRIALMGVGQLGAATAMAAEARAAAQPGWLQFWRFAALAVGAKTLLECLSFGVLGSALAEPLSFPLQGATLGVVLAFLVTAAVLWRQGSLEKFGRTRPATWIAVGVSLAVWLGFSTFPLWGG